MNVWNKSQSRDGSRDRGRRDVIQRKRCIILLENCDHKGKANVETTNEVEQGI